MLREIERLIEQLLHENFRRANDTTSLVALEAGRMGGDEFLVIMAQIYTEEDLTREDDRRSTDPQEQMAGAYNLLRQIERQLLENSEEARAVGIGFSIGSALFDPSHPVDARTLIKQADEAMYINKRERRAGREGDGHLARIRDFLGRLAAKVTVRL